MKQKQKKNNRKKQLVYESVVKETVVSISQLKSELKQLELAAKDQNKSMIQHFTHVQAQMKTFSHKASKGI